MKIDEIVLHDPFCHIGLLKDSVIISCDCSRPKRIDSLKQAMLKIVGEVEGYHGYCPSREQGLRCSIEAESDLRAEQRKRLEEMFR